jgi:hypothetical protein
MDKPESYEVTEYGDDDNQELYDRFAAIKQVVQDSNVRNPASAFVASLQGDWLVLKYHCYEIDVPSQIKAVEDRVNTAFKEMLSLLKKEVKKKTKKVLTLKELKDKADHTIQKVSLNDRYYVVFWRVYEIS